MRLIANIMIKLDVFNASSFFLIVLIGLNFVLNAQEVRETFFDKNIRAETHITKYILPDINSKDKTSNQWRKEVLYPDGKTKLLGFYDHGLWVGIWKRYHENGNLLFEGEYSGGKSIGQHKVFYKSGSIKEIYNNENGNLNGKYIKFYESGDTSNIDEFEDGVAIKRRQFYSDIILDFKIINGFVAGLVTARYYSGKLAFEGRAKNNYKVGKWDYWNNEGVLVNIQEHQMEDSIVIANHNTNVFEDYNQAIGKRKKKLVTAKFKGEEGDLAKFIQSNVTYPRYCKDADIQDRVFIAFDISTSGEVEYVMPYKGRINTQLTEEAIRVVELLPNFEPWKFDDIPTIMGFGMPLNFKLK
jgi:antitoxin component YwqK of YwqJK toxin-antitoxin module